LGVGLQLPLFYWNGGERARAAAVQGSAAANAEKVRIQVQNDLAVALDRFHAAQSLAERYESGLLQKARTALDQSRYAYQAGAASLLDLLDAIRTFSDSESDYLHSLRDYWVAVATLSAAAGRELTPQ